MVTILFQDQIRIMIRRILRHILVEPVRRCECVCFLDGWKFYFCDDKRRQRLLKNIQLDGIRIPGDQISFFGNTDAVGFRKQMLIGGLIERKIIFFPRHQSFSFVGQIIFIILSADAQDGVGV